MNVYEPSKIELDFIRLEPELSVRLSIDDPEDKFNDLISLLRDVKNNYLKGKLKKENLP